MVKKNKLAPDEKSTFGDVWELIKRMEIKVLVTVSGTLVTIVVAACLLGNGWNARALDISERERASEQREREAARRELDASVQARDAAVKQYEALVASTQPKPSTGIPRYPNRPLVHDQKLVIPPVDGFADPSTPRLFSRSTYAVRYELVPAVPGKSIVVTRLVCRLQGDSQSTPNTRNAAYRLLEVGQNQEGQIGPQIYSDSMGRLFLDDHLPIRLSPGCSLQLQNIGMSGAAVWTVLDFRYE